MKRAILIFSIFLSMMLTISLLSGCAFQPQTGPQGEKGEQGEPGATPTIEISEDGFWVINGQKTEHKALGTDGAKGETGKAGLSIQSIAFDDHGRLLVTMSDGTTLDPVSIGNKQEYTHNYGEWIRFHGGDCSNRIFYAVCSECNALTWRHGTFEDHSFTTQTVPPTCVDDGYDLSTCIYCNHQISSAPTDATGHDWLPEIETVSPTCGEQGYDIRSCSVCSTTEKINYTSATGNHSWTLLSNADAWTGADPCHHYEICAVCRQTKNEAACTADATYHCTVCKRIVPTQGCRYEISEDGTYATFKGWDWWDNQNNPRIVAISDNYFGVPVTDIDEYAFLGNETTIILPATITHLPSSWDYYQYMESIIVDEENEVFCSVDGILYSKDMTSLIYYPPSNPITEFTVPASVTTIDENVFLSMNNLKALSFDGNGISELQLDGLEKLETLVVPEGIIRLSLARFTPKKLYLPSTLQELTYDEYDFYTLSELHINMEIGGFIDLINRSNGYYFMGDCWLIGVSLYLKGERIKELIIPAGYSLKNDAFSGLEVERIIVEEGTTHINFNAFSYIADVDIILPKSLVTYDQACRFYPGRIFAYQYIDLYDYDYNPPEDIQYIYSEDPPTVSGNFWHYDENGEIEIWP